MNIIALKLIFLVFECYILEIHSQATCTVRISSSIIAPTTSVTQNTSLNNVENQADKSSVIGGTSAPKSEHVPDHTLNSTFKNGMNHLKKSETGNVAPLIDHASNVTKKLEMETEKKVVPKPVAATKEDAVVKKSEDGSTLVSESTDSTRNPTEHETTLAGDIPILPGNRLLTSDTTSSTDLDKSILPNEQTIDPIATSEFNKSKHLKAGNASHNAVLDSDSSLSTSATSHGGLGLIKDAGLTKDLSAVNNLGSTSLIKDSGVAGSLAKNHSLNLNSSHSKNSKEFGSSENTGSSNDAGYSQSSASGYDVPFTCDSEFYEQWISLNIRCGQAHLNVTAAVAASSCTLSNIQLPMAGGLICVSICSFPSCERGVWDYTLPNGIISPIYRNYSLSSFMTPAMLSTLNMNSNDAPLNSKILATSTITCPIASDESFANCICSDEAGLVTTDTQKRLDRITAMKHGIIPKDSSTKIGTVVTPLAHTITSVAIGGAGLAAISSSGSVTVAAGSSGMNAMATVEFCQFIVAMNCLNITGSSTAQTHIAVQMSYSMFIFPIFKAKQSESHRRLDAQDKSSMSGIAVYSRYVGIDEDMLFLATLAGVGCVLVGVLGLFGLAYVIAGLFMSREKFLSLFYDKMIGLEILILTLSQYTIGLTATYEIYRSFEKDELTDIKLYAALLSLVFLAIGIIFFGYIIVKQNEEQIKDVGTSTHLKKPVCMRYGALYDEYKFKDRYFFAPKMMLVLLAGCVTGLVGISSAVQVGILLSAHVVFFVYLEVRSPHHSRFVQTTTSFVTIMKIAALVLTFFLIGAAGADGFPTELQHGVSLAIVGLNLVVLFMLAVRSLYAFYKKYKLQKQAKRNGETIETVDEYFKGNTPQHPDKLALIPCERDSHDIKSSQLAPSLHQDAQYTVNQDRLHHTQHAAGSTLQCPVTQEYTQGYFHAPRQNYQRDHVVEL